IAGAHCHGVDLGNLIEYMTMRGEIGQDRVGGRLIQYHVHADLLGIDALGGHHTQQRAYRGCDWKSTHIRSPVQFRAMRTADFGTSETGPWLQQKSGAWLTIGWLSRPRSLRPDH